MVFWIYLGAVFCLAGAAASSGWLLAFGCLFALVGSVASIRKAKGLIGRVFPFASVRVIQIDRPSKPLDRRMCERLEELFVDTLVTRTADESHSEHIFRKNAQSQLGPVYIFEIVGFKAQGKLTTGETAALDLDQIVIYRSRIDPLTARWRQPARLKPELHALAETKFRGIDGQDARSLTTALPFSVQALSNEQFPYSLKAGKKYVAYGDEIKCGANAFLAVRDESGELYFYHQSLFSMVAPNSGADNAVSDFTSSKLESHLGTLTS